MRVGVYFTYRQLPVAKVYNIDVIYRTTYIQSSSIYNLDKPVVEHLLPGWKTVVSNSGRVKPKTLKLVLAVLVMCST